MAIQAGTNMTEQQKNIYYQIPCNQQKAIYTDVMGLNRAGYSGCMIQNTKEQNLNERLYTRQISEQPRSPRRATQLARSFRYAP
jgi:hypothetical protein